MLLCNLQVFDLIFKTESLKYGEQQVTKEESRAAMMLGGRAAVPLGYLLLCKEIHIASETLISVKLSDQKTPLYFP